MMQRLRSTAIALLGAAVIGWAVAPIAARAADASVPILLCDRFSPRVPGSSTVTTPVFEEQLAWLAEHRYKVERLASVNAARRDGAAIDSMSVAITVDDRRRSQFTEMLSIVLRYHVR